MSMRLPLRAITTACLILMTSSLLAAPGTQYRVTITNITKAQTFSPQLVVTHREHVALFNLGRPASPGLAFLAEDGNTGLLAGELTSLAGGAATPQTIGGLLAPGASASITVSPTRHQTHLSVAAMLIPTNDAFMAVTRLRLPRVGQRVAFARAYDSGTEANDQNCRNIPGPRCGGTGHSPGANAGDEGYVHIGNGFHELAPDVGGDILSPLTYDWRNPVAEIVVERIR